MAAIFVDCFEVDRIAAFASESDFGSILVESVMPDIHGDIVSLDREWRLLCNVDVVCVSVRACYF